MSITVTMPQMGESVVEGTIEKWCVQVGERVAKDQTLCEVTTDKVDAEIPAPEAGVISKILVSEGETVDVGAGLATLEAGPGAEAAVPASPAPEATAPAVADTAATQGAAAPAPPAPGAPVRTSPVARRMAEEHGVDLSGVPRSGERVMKSDLIDYMERGQTPAAAPAPGGVPATAQPGSVAEMLARMKVPTYQPREGDQVIPFSAIRRRVAEHMVVSKIVSPHVGTLAEVDLDSVVRFRDRVKASFEREHGFKLTYLPFVVHATVRALREYPRVNATVVGESIVERNGIHIGVAVETERGLLVPVIRHADRYSLTGLAEVIRDLAERARDRKITADELQGGTFTVTNPGREGNLFGFAVINQPQVGILRTGEVKKRPVVVERDGEDLIAIRPMMYLALSYDHRIIDGATGNGFLHRLARNLESDDFEL